MLTGTVFKMIIKKIWEIIHISILICCYLINGKDAACLLVGRGQAACSDAAHEPVSGQCFATALP